MSFTHLTFTESDSLTAKARVRYEGAPPERVWRLWGTKGGGRQPYAAWRALYRAVVLAGRQLAVGFSCMYILGSAH